MALFGYNAPTTQATVDPEYERMVNLQTSQARTARAQMPNLAAQQQAQTRTAGRQQLAGQIAGVKRGASSRGLLYSGLRQAGEAQAGQEAAANIAAQSRAINERLEDKISSLENQAVQGGLGLQAAKQQVASSNFAAQEEARKKSGLSGLLGTLGQVGGTVVGSMK